ncbi:MULTISPECIES: Tol-Pal system beta propeller repeat protein TolB [unclassified Halomonas]|uniref:Tol-Pal system beta propeller repeat protein TolB n=1 Tax=unclassified Halomonas TaxID=2609666 RepID=UPI00054AA01A|nr:MULTISPECIES: Tol-Pal system beta propeller repeat protein TolB [unclassified Halomonas]ATH78884.1 Tol-Pal system beta propeller repeat protein TolB [Halomonas hydrothermalis]KHJ51492.1 translocation protein TolB [Halomonas hydrothermalis]MDM7482220.1 Tol-Pal system beta propeller repeat protein TolB [Halomonas sp.]UDM08967.1 Tol-Pal system beta propeller repeat protein TolB [Halomonas sp. NyZ770]
MQTLSKVWLFCVLLLISSVASANLTIEITRGSDRALPIGVVPFEGGEGFPEDVAQIIQDNLERSGFFSPLDRGAMFERPSQASDVQFGTWRSLDVRYLVVGRARQSGSGYELQFDLMDISGQRPILSETVTANSNDLRGAAHYISDEIFEAITDIRGAFSTRIAYVTAQGVGDNMQFGLYVADADGRRSQQVLTSDQPIMSPAWSPDGRKLAYVSFESGQAAIYIQDVATGQRVQATSFDGINGAPTWSPDGRRIAMSLSKDGQPEIYILDVANRSVERVTQSNSIDTEPAWSPDGRSLIFTSDRSGGPQIYQYSLGSGETNRITFTGNYNARARFSPDGEEIFFIHRSSRGYQVAKQDLGGGRLVVLSESTRDESPSVAPNGTMVIFATQQGSAGVLSAVSADGRSSFRLPAAQGEVRDPAWSPFLN